MNYSITYRILKLHISFFILLAANSAMYKPLMAQNAQASQLFETYKKDKYHSLLPDFSYAGYHCGERPVAAVNNFKVFNVIDFGAVPNDDISDRKAIQAAIDAANQNGSGIVLFPKGIFIANDDSTLGFGIVSKGSNIIFRGSGSGHGGTELFMKAPLVPENPKQMWTGRPMFTVTGKGSDELTGSITNPASVGDMHIELDTTSNLKTGDWVALKMLSNDPQLIAAELAPHRLDSSWKYLLEQGVNVCMYYQVKEISKNKIKLHAPLAYAIDPKYDWSVYRFAHAEEVGIEDIAFVGNWKEKFEHHASWKHDSGFNLFLFTRCTNSWMRNCRFTDCSIGAMVNQSANITVMNCIISGNPGHEAISSTHSTNILLSGLVDEASQWHSFGSSHGAINTVIWNCRWPSTTCFESHASQPRNTLLDNVTGGFMAGRQGGAIANLPNHLSGMVIWNYTQTSAPIKDFQFWPEEDIWMKMVRPVIAGFKSNGTTFREDQLAWLEGLGKNVWPKSLYKAQLEMRFKKGH